MNNKRETKYPEFAQRQDLHTFLHTEKAHKNWYHAGLMGNLGDRRGYRVKGAAKPGKQQSAHALAK